MPVRQWVLSLPIPLRLLLAAQPVLATPVLQVVHRVITHHLLEQTGFKADQADSGAVTLIQRFGSAANLNIHLHCLVLDGVYRRTDSGPVFVQADSPTDEALQALLHKIISRLMKLLTRRSVLIEEEEGGPRARLHLIRFHGVLAPNAKLRALGVPRAPEEATGESEVPATESGCTLSRPARISWPRLLKRVLATT